MKGTLSKVLIVIGVILIVAAILWWAIAVNLLVKFPSDVNVTPIYEGDVDVYQDLLTGQLVKQPTNFPLSIERHYESVSDEYDSSKAVVIESITQKIEVPLAPVEEVDTSQYVIDRKTIENVDDPRSWAFQPRFPVNRAGSFYLSFPMDLDKDKDYPIYENKVAGTYPMTKQTEEDEQDLEGLKVYLFEGALEPTKVTADYLEYVNSGSPGQYPTTLSFDGLKAMITADGVSLDPYLALLNATLTPEELAKLNEVISKPIDLTYKFYTGGKVAIEPKTGSIIRLYDVTEGFMVEPEAGALFETLQTLLSSFAVAHPDQLKDPTQPAVHATSAPDGGGAQQDLRGPLCPDRRVDQGSGPGRQGQHQHDQLGQGVHPLDPADHRRGRPGGRAAHGGDPRAPGGGGRRARGCRGDHGRVGSGQ